MASGSSSILNLATTTASALNFQIPPINIKLDRNNFSLWRTTIISALETFDLEDFVLNPKPPSATIEVAVVQAVAATATSPAVTVVEAHTAPNPGGQVESDFGVG
ncbi:hypothetical protein LXL04_000726 [Taraxacum kok-saghyz]